jgi:hypothetical protein
VTAPLSRLPDVRSHSIRPVLYADPARAAELGLPPHLRAASSVVLVGDHLFAVQDDVHAIARIDPLTATAEPIPLALPGALVRSKAEKADLEAAALLPDGALLVLGSGSRATRRVAIEVDPASGASKMLHPTALYDALDRMLEPLGASVNVEGVTIAGEHAHLLSRGTGGGSDAGPNAIVRLPTARLIAALREGSPVPREEMRAMTVDLGQLDGVRLTWTDGVDVYGLGILFTAAAEENTHVEEDAACVGSVIGVLSPSGRISIARLLDPGGAPLRCKVEGLTLAGHRGWLVVDADDPEKPSDLVEIPLGTLGPTA